MSNKDIPSINKVDTLRFILKRLRFGQHKALTDLAEKYGSFFRATFQGKHFFVINDPKWLRHILVSQQRNYSKAAIFDRLGPVLGSGLFTADGAFWKRQRQLIQPAYAPKQLEIYAHAIEKHCQVLIERLKLKAARGERFDIYPEVVHLTLDVVMETILGSQSQQFHQRVHQAISIIIDQMEVASVSQRLLELLPIMKYVPFWRHQIEKKQQKNAQGYQAALNEFNQILFQIVSKRQRQLALNPIDQPRDVLSLLIKARDDQREGMSDEQLRDELAIAFVAGHETSAVALAWAFVLLAQNPCAADRLSDELSRILQGSSPQVKHLEELPYTKAVVQETLRLYPPVWRLIRTAEIDDELGGTKIPKGSIIVMVPYITQRLAQYWPDPDQFQPLRFLDNNSSRELLSYLPFGAGPRVCIGQNFAMNEMIIALASVWQRFELQLDPATDLAMDAKLSLRPRHPLWFKARWRN